MKAPRYYGDPEEYLRALACRARGIPELGLHVGLDLERLAEDLVAADEVHALEVRDLSRQLEDS